MGDTKRILLAEDDTRDLELTLAAFEEIHLKNEVHAVRDGEEALDYLYRRGAYKLRTDGNPVVVLLDLKMPRMGGLDVLKVLRADETFRLMPVVMLTSSREECDIVESYRLGTNGYVVKPVDFGQFIEAVKNLGLYWVLENESPHSIKRGVNP